MTCKGKYYCEDLNENLEPADACFDGQCYHKEHCTVYKGPQAPYLPEGFYGRGAPERLAQCRAEINSLNGGEKLEK